MVVGIMGVGEWVYKNNGRMVGVFSVQFALLTVYIPMIQKDFDIYYAKKVGSQMFYFGAK